MIDDNEEDQDGSNGSDNNDNRMTKEGFFNSLLLKYSKRSSQNPDKDKRIKMNIS